MLIPYQIAFNLNPVYKHGALALWAVDEEHTFEKASFIVVSGDSRLNGTYPISSVTYTKHTSLPKHTVLIYTDKGIFNEEYAKAFNQSGGEPIKVSTLQIQPQCANTPDLTDIDVSIPGSDSSASGFTRGMENWGTIIKIAIILVVLYLLFNRKK